MNEIERSFFERRFLSHQAGPGLVTRVFVQHDVVFYPPVYFYPTVPEAVANPDCGRLIRQAHVFAGTWVEKRRRSHDLLWEANSTKGEFPSGAQLPAEPRLRINPDLDPN